MHAWRINHLSLICLMSVMHIIAIYLELGVKKVMTTEYNLDRYVGLIVIQHLHKPSFGKVNYILSETDNLTFGVFASSIDQIFWLL